MCTRGRMEAESLVRLVLVLVVAWLALEVVTAAGPGAVLSSFRPLVGLATLAVLVLWLLGRL